MIKMGFNAKWIQWIMMCVTTDSYYVALNGTEFGPIQPYKGLRQVDPLFPYLFIICAKGLLAMFRWAEIQGAIHGNKISRQAPGISHLLFADDSFFFFQAKEEECTVIRNILSIYEAASG